MPNHGVVPSLPGWMIVTQKAVEVAGLAMVERLLLTAPVTREERPTAPADVPTLPEFIGEVADDRAHYHRAQLRDGNYLFAGFYADGRVRMATPEGRRFSGIMVDRRAVMADLREDVSFEAALAVAAQVGDPLLLEIDGGPYDGQTLHCETIT